MSGNSKTCSSRCARAVKSIKQAKRRAGEASPIVEKGDAIYMKDGRKWTKEVAK